ncbi:MAG TPA: hypothetical protein VF473_04120 [Cyclobacteriaceae bacterium]
MIFHGGIEIAGGQKPIADDEDYWKRDDDDPDGKDEGKAVPEYTREEQNPARTASVVHGKKDDGGGGLPNQEVGAESQGVGELTGY